MLFIDRAERADVLAQALARLLTRPRPDPFATDLVAVPTRGIERWLAQTLATQLGSDGAAQDGVCANVSFPSPLGLVRDTLARATGLEPEHDPWRRERMLWPLIEVVQNSREEPWLEPLLQHLRDDSAQRYTRISHVAELFDEYAIHRPELICAWARGESGAAWLGASDGEVAGPATRAALAWQPELWRRLRAAIGVPSPAERVEPACAALHANPGLVDLPELLSFFGLTRLTPALLRVIQALADRREVHLMLLHPSPDAWATGTAENRLLGSWGRDVMSLQPLLAGIGAQRHHTTEPTRPSSPAESPPPAAPRSLLAALQADIIANRKPPGAPHVEGARDARVLLPSEDRSIQIHICHGRARQVAVLQEAILHRLADDPTLEPRDVIVMCPDIEAFAPMIEAAFATSQAHAPGPLLEVRLADRSPRRTTPLLAVLVALLELAGGRVTASAVLDLADSEPVRRRFAFDDDELAQIRNWVAAAEIHWGIDAKARSAYHLDDRSEGTWEAGLKRLLLGVALDSQARAPVGGALPPVPIQSSQIELAGRLHELLDRLAVSLAALAGPQPLLGWSTALAAATDALTASGPDDAWQRHQLDLLLDQMSQEAGEYGQGATELTRTEFAALLAEHLRARPTRAGFRSGHLTFCTLAPMRSVPHRVVCLLGLDDGYFPRSLPHDGDNLLRSAPQPGDRDPRSEDRQLLLDALLAAQDALVITYNGHDERTNAPLAPAVVVSELLDACEATARTDASVRGAATVREQLLVRHPLQPFDPQNFMSAASAPARAAGGPWSFDEAALAGARAVSSPRLPPTPFLESPLPPAPGAESLTLAELIEFLRRPVRAFLRQRLAIVLEQDEVALEDALPIELDPLERWAVGQRLVEAISSGLGPHDAYRAEIARGTLPPGALGVPVIRSILPTAQLIAETARAYAGGHAVRSQQTNLVLTDGRRLTGTVSAIYGHVLVTASYSRPGPRQRLEAWTKLLALSAADPTTPYEAVTIGRGDGQDPLSVIRLPQLGATAQARQQRATAELERLCALREVGLREPLPLPCRSAHAYAQAALQTGGDPVAAAMRCWRTGWSRGVHTDGEDADPEHRLAFADGELDIARLAELASDLWRPLFAHELKER
jgi:exodeoxyribonuclease V gamma subunit